MILLVDKGDRPPLRRLIIPFLFVTALFVTLYMRRVDPAFVTVQLSGQTMGTTYMVKVVVPGDKPAQTGPMSDTIQTTLEQVNASMSTYRKDSELSRFNGTRNRDPFPASDGLRDVVGQALAISRATKGAFDPTVGPLVNAWGFGPEGRQKRPAPETLAELMARTGYQKLTLDPKSKTLAKTQPDLYVDLSAIAKGYGVDAVGEALEKLGYRDYLVEIGGELRARGLNQRRIPWRVAVEKPKATRGEVHINAIIALGDRAMATSGDYRNYYEEKGQRISHTINPFTGRPITHRLASVTVVAKTCAQADGWATALNVLGPKAGLALATQEKLNAFFLVRRKDGGFDEVATKGFEQLRRASKLDRSSTKKSATIKP